MKSFFKVVGALATIFAVAFAALAIFDRLSNKNRIKNGYLECELDDGDVEEE